MIDAWEKWTTNLLPNGGIWSWFTKVQSVKVTKQENKSKVFIKTDAPPKFNIAPKKWWLEDYFPIGVR